MRGSVLVTGGTGFLGSHLVRCLVEAGEDVIVLKRVNSNLHRIRDLLNRIELQTIHDGSFRDFLTESHVRIIVHCATDYGRREVSPREMIDANLMLPLRLLESMVDTPAKAFINTDTLLDKRINHYSLSKRHFREWLEIFPLPLTRCNVALEHFYGPGDDRTKFVTRVVTELLSDQSSMDLTPGEQQRDFIFITDVIDAMKKIIDFADGAPPGYYPFEVGGGEATEIREFVRLAQKLVGNQSTNLRFGALPYRTNEIMSSHVDLSALRELGWEPQVGLVEGLLKTIEGERRQLWPRSI